MELTGCTALVTGGNRGIGAAFVRELIAAGAQRVYAGCRDPEGEREFPLDDERIVSIQLDVTDEDRIAEVAQHCKDTNVIINNAGYFANTTLLGAPDLSSARAEMETNFFGVLAMCRHFAPLLAANGGGAIVNVLSAAAIVAVPNMGGYSPSKFAARALTTSLRAELADQGTQMHSLIVGSVDTRMASHVEGAKEPPETVARAGLRAIRKNIPEVDTDDFAVSVRAAQARDPALLEKQMAAMLKMTTLSTGR